MKDIVIIKDYEVVACHGVNAEEKVNPQRFLFTIEVGTDFSCAQFCDNINATVSYSAVKKLVKSYCDGNSFDLIESLATGIADLVLKSFHLAQNVHVTVKKPDAPMSGVFDYVAVSVERKWHTVYLAIGSNLGDKQAYLDFAIDKIKADDNFKNIVESKRIVTEPYGGVAQNNFLNSVVKCNTLYSPMKLLEFLHCIENEGGRVRKEHWGNRTLDIDIIFFDDIVLGENALAIPHMDMQNRLFVLQPLMELCPNYVHPLLKRRVSELYYDLITTKK